MKQTIFKKLLYITLTAFSLNVIPKNVVFTDEESNRPTITIGTDIAGGGGDLSLGWEYKYVLSEEKDTNFQFVKINLGVNNPMSINRLDKIRTGFYEGKKLKFGKGISTLLVTCLKEVTGTLNEMDFNGVKVNVKNIGFSNKFKNCFQRGHLPFGAQCTVGGLLPAEMLLNAELAFDMLDYANDSDNHLKKWELGFGVQAKDIVYEGSSLGVDFGFTFSGKYYSSSYVGEKLNWLHGISAVYKLPKEGYAIRQLKLNCSLPMLGTQDFGTHGKKVINKGSGIHFSCNLDGGFVSDLVGPTLSSMKPEKLDMGTFKGFTFGLGKSFTKKEKVGDDIASVVAEVRKGFYFSFTGDFKDVFGKENCDLKVGVKLQGGGKEDRVFIPIISLSMKVDL